MKVLVTGATGFIGGEIKSRLVADGFNVTGIARRREVYGKDKKILGVDITDREKVFELTKEGNFEAIIHCAGLAHQFGTIEEGKFEKVNVSGTENIADLAVKLRTRHFILMSSTAVYGLRESPSDELSPCLPETAYAKSKLKAESICRVIFEKNKIPLTIFRLAPVLGEKGVGNVPRLIKAVEKKRFIWVGGGENKKSLIYVGDVAEACIKILKEKKGDTEIFNLAAEPIRLKKLVEVISERLDRAVPEFSVPVFFPEMVFRLNSNTLRLNSIERLSKTLEKWLSEDVYPAEKIKSIYGFEAKTSVEDAVRKQCDWFRQRNQK